MAETRADSFRVSPEIAAHVPPLSDEEARLLEESILAEGCRDPLVVWGEENVLVDGHNRKSICDRHGLSYQVVHRSFPDIEAAKAWMDLNQLGRRNLTREQRDEMIRRLAASGIRQKEIAEKTGLSKQTVSDIIRESGNRTEKQVKQISAVAELEAKQRENELLRQRLLEEQSKARHDAPPRYPSLIPAQEAEGPTQRGSHEGSPQEESAPLPVEEHIRRRRKIDESPARAIRGINSICLEYSDYLPSLRKLTARDLHADCWAAERARDTCSEIAEILTRLLEDVASTRHEGGGIEGG